MDGWASYLVFAVVGGLWPASIARRKGHNLWKWWLYAAALPFVAWVHAILLPVSRPAAKRVSGLSA